VDLTFFEITTLVAFLEFRAREVGLAIVETGLGGRLDATNVVRSVAAVITTIGMDHERFLGHSVGEIASEKAGILRSSVPLVTGDLPDEAMEVVAIRATAVGSRWLCYGRDFGPFGAAEGPSTTGSLLGPHQRHNAGVAAAVVSALADAFPVPADACRCGILSTRWPGRLELFPGPPLTVIDAAHNPQAVTCLLAGLETLPLESPRVLLFGVMADKDWREMLCRLVPSFQHVVLAPVDNPRSLDPRLARSLIEGLRPCRVAGSAADAWSMARELAEPRGSVVITGSIFLIGELYRLCGGAEDPFAHAT
jgi:dihydrofolate synthase/folylpolyglutamate synthase